MKGFNTKTLTVWLLGASALFWGIGVPLIDYLPQYQPISVDLFRFLNALAIAMGFSVLITYWSVIIDMVKNLDSPVTGSQLLIVGGTLNWVGIVTRRIMWYLWGQYPSLTPLEETYSLIAPKLWAYNAGLWISILAGALLIMAVDYTYPDQDFKNAKRSALIVGVILTISLVFLEFTGVSVPVI